MIGHAGYTLFADRVLLADGLAPANVVVTDGRIASIRPGKAAVDAHHLPGRAILAPGFIDVQVNGGGGLLFNDAPTPETLRTIAAAHRAGGTTGFLPTLITDRPGLIECAAQAVRSARTAPGHMILGLHLEGPFISRRRPGVHAPEWIRPMSTADRTQLCTLAGRDGAGVLLLTLAPEEVTDDDLRTLSAAGVVLAAGHTEASAARLADARRAGLRGFTHLWNAMPPVAGRAPGPIAACLLDDDAWCGLIVDGHHVDPANLRLTTRCKPGRVFLVTDAMPPAGTTMTGFALQGRPIRRKDGRLTSADGTLAGADLTMIEAVRNAITLADVTLADALRMAAEVPAAFLGLAGLAGRGRIAVGCHADLVVLSDELEVLDTAVAGVWRDGGELSPTK